MVADQGGEGILSPFLRRQRIRAAKPYLRGRVLDVGCGSGMLAPYVDARDYLGVDIDPVSLQKARTAYPGHHFQNGLPDETEKFDTVVALAVIEHVPDASAFLRELALHLLDDHSLLVCTTPHPALEWVHDLGAAIGLFSKHANEEHEELLDRRRLAAVSAEAGLRMLTYQPFLWRANQLAVFQFEGHCE